MTIQLRVLYALIAVMTTAGCGATTKPSGSGSAGGSVTKGSAIATIVTAAAPAATPVATPAATPAAAEIKLTPMRFAALQELIATKKGKVVVMDVWSTYCEPCMKEFPGLVALAKKHGPEKVACISLCANYSGIGKPTDPENIDEPLKFLKDQGATFDNVLAADPDTKLYEDLKIASVPAVFVYDRDGKVLKIFENEAKYSEIEAFVAQQLK
jgi:thiol-disulfide isomerase/thioredoxin